MIDWTRKIDAEDPQWIDAENACYWLAAMHPSVRGWEEDVYPNRWGMQRWCENRPGWQHMPGRGSACPWVWAPKSDRVVAYHGFDGTWVGWDRGGMVLKLRFEDLPRFLSDKEWRP